MFACLHARSWFSFLNGGSSPEALADRASRLGVKALALTDRNGVYGAARLYKVCTLLGIKPIYGAELTLDDGTPLVLLARSNDGYANLCRLLTEAHQRDRLDPRLSLNDLGEYTADLFCLTGARGSRLRNLVEERKLDEARRLLRRLRAIFGDGFFVELCHHARRGDSMDNAILFRLAADEDIAPVASGDVHYAAGEDYMRYDLLTCIRLGLTVFDAHRERPVNAEACLRSREAMRCLIPYPAAFDNAARIAEACQVELFPGHVVPPHTRLPAGVDDGAAYLRSLCRAALPRLYPNEKARVRAAAQMDRELAVIIDLELEEFFLVVREVIDEARRRNIRCAGRGSAANSIVAYLLGITAVDPVRHRLLFERFLHRGRKGTPDIDVDFDSDRRDEIIAWMEERFGMEQTAMTATLITYRLRSALRDSAKALGYPLPLVDRMCKAVPHAGAGQVRVYRDNLTEVAGESPLLETLLDMVERLEGCPRHLGLHSGGMVLSRIPLYKLTPVQVSANGVKVVQFDKDDVEAFGLVKFDVLGLRMLATIGEALEVIERSEGRAAPLDEAPLDEPKVFNLIRAGKTIGVFQIESQGQMHLLAQHQPEVFDDLISEVALFRPGPLQGGMVNPFVRRRRGMEPVHYEHPDLEPVLRDTYGVILFQEQILEIAHRFAGMSLEEADDFRALMSKFRDPGEMERMRGAFVGGAVARGVPPATADSVFDKVSKFVGYGFCRSHAAAFAKTVYQSAWLKVFYPAAYMAAFMQHRPGFYPLLTLEEEARRMGVAILLPCINRSGVRYDIERGASDEPWRIRKPLSSIKHVSDEDARAVVMERLAAPFSSVEDFMLRVRPARDVAEALARGGAFDGLAGDARRALWLVGVLLRRLAPEQDDTPRLALETPLVVPRDVPALEQLDSGEQVAWDFATHGAARVHPMTLIRRSLNDLEVRPIGTAYRMRSRKRFRSDPDPQLLTAGIVILRQRPPTARGVMFVTIEDETGFMQCVVLPEVQEILMRTITGPALIVQGPLHIMGNWRGLVVEQAWPLRSVAGGFSGHPSASGGQDQHVRQAEYSEQELRALSKAMRRAYMVDSDGRLVVHTSGPLQQGAVTRRTS